jgi:hypothetical protein
MEISTIQTIILLKLFTKLVYIQQISYFVVIVVAKAVSWAIKEV